MFEVHITETTYTFEYAFHRKSFELIFRQLFEMMAFHPFYNPYSFLFVKFNLRNTRNRCVLNMKTLKLMLIYSVITDNHLSYLHSSKLWCPQTPLPLTFYRPLTAPHKSGDCDKLLVLHWLSNAQLQVKYPLFECYRPGAGDAGGNWRVVAVMLG